VKIFNSVVYGENIMTKILFIFLICLSPWVVSEAAFDLNDLADMEVFIKQDFSDPEIFIPGQAISLHGGVGDGNDIVGFWQGLTVNLQPFTADMLPVVYGDDQSAFSGSPNSIQLERNLSSFIIIDGEAVSTGLLKGSRTNRSLTGRFYVEFTYKLTDLSCQFSFILMDDANQSLPIGVFYHSNMLYSYHNGEWKSRTSGVYADNWFKIALIGDTTTGKYDLYMNRGLNQSRGWQPIYLDNGFDISTPVNIAGFRINPTAGFTYLDDVLVLGEFTVPVSCGEAMNMGYGFDGDLNGDCQTDIDDLLILIDRWLNCSDPQNPNCLQ
jgi:hypothetical protein